MQVVKLNLRVQLQLNSMYCVVQGFWSKTRIQYVSIWIQTPWPRSPCVTWCSCLFCQLIKYYLRLGTLLDPPGPFYILSSPEPSKAFKTNKHYINEDWGILLISFRLVCHKRFKPLAQDIIGHKLGDLITKNKSNGKLEQQVKLVTQVMAFVFKS